MFRNLRLYKLSSEWPGSEQDLSDALVDGEFTPCGSLSERSLGWEPRYTLREGLEDAYRWYEENLDTARGGR